MEPGRSRSCAEVGPGVEWSRRSQSSHTGPGDPGTSRFPEAEKARYAMSVVAFSETAGSLGAEVARETAATLGYDFADREIITKAAERFHEDESRLAHFTEERPTLRERLSEAQ
jgi:hypothetical protein